MSQYQIIQTLQKNKNKWYTYKDLQEILELSKASVTNNLKRLKKTNLVHSKLTKTNHKPITKYKHKQNEKEM